MSEQSKLLAEMHEIVMLILKNGMATPEQGARMDELEALLFEQKCYKEIDHAEYTYQGEEIAALFASGKKTEAINKMLECEITPEDFFGFLDYHDEDEEFTEILTSSFISDAIETYKLQSQSA